MAFVPSEADLSASAPLIGLFCSEINFKFLTCRAKNRETPLECLGNGQAAYTCAQTVMETAHSECPDTFAKFSKCLADNNSETGKCTEAGKAFLACMKPLMFAKVPPPKVADFTPPAGTKPVALEHKGKNLLEVLKEEQEQQSKE